MPECGAVESALGVAVAKMETAKREALQVFEAMYPGMIADRQRNEWLMALMSAHLALEVATSRIGDASAMLHKEGERIPIFSAHPKESELSRQEQPTKENIGLADPPPIKTDAQDKRCESLLITLRDIRNEADGGRIGISAADRLGRIASLVDDVFSKWGKPSA